MGVAGSYPIRLAQAAVWLAVGPGRALDCIALCRGLGTMTPLVYLTTQPRPVSPQLRSKHE